MWYSSDSSSNSEDAIQKNVGRSFMLHRKVTTSLNWFDWFTVQTLLPQSISSVQQLIQTKRFPRSTEESHSSSSVWFRDLCKTTRILQGVCQSLNYSLPTLCILLVLRFWLLRIRPFLSRVDIPTRDLDCCRSAVLQSVCHVPMLKLHIESWKLLEPDKCVVTEGVGDLWPLIISSNTHAGCRLTRYTFNVLLTTKIRLDKHT